MYAPYSKFDWWYARLLYKFATFLLPVCVVDIAVNLDEPSRNFEFFNRNEMFVDKESIFYSSYFHCPNNYYLI
jgi:hypothetical protein